MTGTVVYFDNGVTRELSIARDTDIVKLVHRKETPEEEIARLKEESAKWQKLAEEFRDKCEKFFPLPDGVSYEGPEVDAFFRILRGLEKIARQAVKENSDE